jgi:hypothetical protein
MIRQAAGLYPAKLDKRETEEMLKNSCRLYENLEAL